jgi:hypothetical protein
MRRILVPALLVVSVVLAGCARTSAASSAPGGTPNFVLYVSNQSFADDSVDVRVGIDGSVVVDETFLVESQHTWIEYELSLPAGPHTLTASSGTGATLTEELDLPAEGTRWAVLSYWYDAEGTPREFTFTLHDRPVGFD